MIIITEEDIRISNIIRNFPVGTPITIIGMADPESSVKPATKGTVIQVFDDGTLLCSYEDGSEGKITPGKDAFHRRRVLEDYPEIYPDAYLTETLPFTKESHQWKRLYEGYGDLMYTQPLCPDCYKPMMYRLNKYTGWTELYCEYCEEGSYNN